MERDYQRAVASRNHSAANSLVQLKPNKTGLPDNLKSGIENLSGHSMDDVKVHYNSSRPAQLQAHAFAQGNQIHLAPGQEKHLPHEAWHVVQQKQGRVRPTMQLKSNVLINDNLGLENEADVMGLRAAQLVPVIHNGIYATNGLRDSVHHYSRLDILQGKFSKTTLLNFNPDKVIQLQGPDFLTKRVKGGLIISEGILTLLSGISGIVAFNTFRANNSNPSSDLESSWEKTRIMGITNICSGILKIIRGLLVFIWGDEAKCPTNILRLFESISTLVGGGLALNPFAITSGIVKLVRSILIAIKDHYKNISGLGAKGLMFIASGLHYLEVAIAGGSVIKNVADFGSSSSDLERRLTIVHGATTGLTAISKNRRSKDDLDKAKAATPRELGYLDTMKNWWQST